MEIKSDDKHAQKKLDLEFQRILRIIKSYIPFIVNKYYLTLYRMWLEKLSEIGLQEKEERNRYLIELCHQIQDGMLEKPFTELPSSGPLPPLGGDLQNNKTQQHSFQELAPVREAPCQNFILKDIDYVDKIVASPKKAQNRNNENSLKNKSKTIQAVPKYTHNSEMPAVYKNRNQHTIFKHIQNQKLDQINMIDGAVKNFPKSLKNFYTTQFLSESNIFQEKVAKKYLQPYFANVTPFPQKQQHNRCYLRPQEQHITHKENELYQRRMHPQPVQKELPENAFCTAQKLTNFQPQRNCINISIRSNKKDGDGDSSWCDLTDVSSTTVTKMGSGDLDNMSLTLNNPELGNNDSQNYLYEMYDDRIMDLMNIITELQKQNLSLNEDVTKYERDLSLRNAKAETSIHNLSGEVKSLKSRLQELTEIKTALKNSQFTATSQWKSTVNALNKELCVTQNQNLALKEETIELKNKLEKLSLQKQKFQDSASLKQKLFDMHAKEIEMLKQNHVKHVASIENKFTQILTERENVFCQRQRDLKTFYERKCFDFISEYDKTVKNKNVVIQKLESTIENQCKRTHEEIRGIRSQLEEHSNISSDTNLEKIAFLQKCLWKMDRLYKKSEKKYNKQITKLKHEIEMKDKAIQIQLTTQRAELLATTNTKRQVETDATVMLLEERYKKLLESQQTHFLSEKQNDAKLISNLRETLARNSVAN